MVEHTLKIVHYLKHYLCDRFGTLGIRRLIPLYLKFETFANAHVAITRYYTLLTNSLT